MLKMKKLTRSLLACALVVSACSPDSTKDENLKVPDEGMPLAKDTLITGNFTEKEMDGLEEILRFFDRLLMDKYNTNSPAKAYARFMKKQSQTESWEELYKHASLADQKELVGFLSQINETAFYNIWMDNTYQHPESGEVLFVMGLSPNGHYKDFLQETARIVEALNSYQVLVLIDQRVTPETAREFVNLHGKLDYSRQSMRLLVAVHYISLMAEKQGIGSHLL
jgi:hypothetical protein